MTKFVLTPPTAPSVAVAGSTDRFPIRRVFCVGRNYAAHAREMGKDPTREPPFFFMKPADTVVPAIGVVPYPTLTADFHHEVELVVAIGNGGINVKREDALSLVWGYGVGVDLTRRDIQDKAKKMSRPWDWAKGFDASAPCSPLQPVAGDRPPGGGPYLARGQWHAEAGRRSARSHLADRRRHQLRLPGGRAGAR